jgi:hypothetical protein
MLSAMTASVGAVDLLGEDFLDAVETGDKVRVDEDWTVHVG